MSPYSGSPWAPFILAHGFYLKLMVFGPVATAGFFEDLSLPAFLAYLIIAGETAIASARLHPSLERGSMTHRRPSHPPQRSVAPEEIQAFADEGVVCLRGIIPLPLIDRLRDGIE